MLVTFIPYFTRFSVDLYLKITFFMVYDEKNCCFSTFAQQTFQSGQTRKVQFISKKAEKSWGGDGLYMSTSTHKGYPNLTQFRLTDLGTRFMASIWWQSDNLIQDFYFQTAPPETSENVWSQSVKTSNIRTNRIASVVVFVIVIVYPAI